MAEKIGVFVSHHHSPEEDAFTVRLVADLEAAGADVWVDTGNITSGSFVQKINEGLAGRQWLVLVMTPGALGSPWVNDEVNAALHQVKIGRMRDVIPFVMTPCDEALIPPLWAQLHRYDATKNYEAARDALLRAIGLSQQPETSAPPPPLQGDQGNQGDADATLTLVDNILIHAEFDMQRLKTLDGLLSLAPVKFRDAVALMLTANGYDNVRYADLRYTGRLYAEEDLFCTTPDGHSAYVWCKAFPLHLLVDDTVVAAAIRRWSGDSGLVVIATTSRFTRAAQKKAKAYRAAVRLLDGKQLVTMMQRVQPQ
jgi:hypothetical protein